MMEEQSLNDIVQLVTEEGHMVTVPKLEWQGRGQHFSTLYPEYLENTNNFHQTLIAFGKMKIPRDANA